MSSSLLKTHSGPTAWRQAERAASKAVELTFGGKGMRTLAGKKVRGSGGRDDPRGQQLRAGRQGGIERRVAAGEAKRARLLPVKRDAFRDTRGPERSRTR